MTKTVEISRGMARKLERHMPLKGRLVGKCFVISGLVLLSILTFLWSQYLFPTMLDAHVAFDVCRISYFMPRWSLIPVGCTKQIWPIHQWLDIRRFRARWQRLSCSYSYISIQPYILGIANKMQLQTFSSSTSGTWLTLKILLKVVTSRVSGRWVPTHTWNRHTSMI